MTGVVADDGGGRARLAGRAPRATGYRLAADPDSRCIVVVWRGGLDLAAFAAFVADAMVLPVFADRRGVLHDLREAEIEVGFRDLDKAKSILRPALSGDTPERRIAAVVNSPHQFGVTRQALVKVETGGDVLVTYSAAEARAFVGLPEAFDLPAGG